MMKTTMGKILKEPKKLTLETCSLTKQIDIYWITYY